MTKTLNFARHALRGGAALQALALLGAGLGMTAIAAPAAAQDYTSGAIGGTVVGQDNKPVAGAQITLRSESQGQERTLTASSGGAFSAVGLTPGAYQVTVHADGYQDLTDTVNVVVAQDNRVTLSLLPVGAASADVVVTGARVRQDFTKSTTGLNIDVPATTAQVAIPRSITGLTLLAPGTTRGVAGFTSNGDQVPSIGGSSVAENAYYINGLNITNPDTYVGSARVPFDFYKTVDVQTGGYAAEFGRATGGVINATTKSGSNTPFFGMHGNFQPSVFQQVSPNIGDPTNPSTLGNLGKTENDQLSVEAGGALWKDHLFFYGLFQANGLTTTSVSPSAGTYTSQHTSDPFYGGKVDLYVTPTQHLEFTYFNTTQDTTVKVFSFKSNANFTDGTVGGFQGTEYNRTGGEDYVARYTGNITDFFTISGAYGVNHDANDLAPTDALSYYIRDQRSGTSPNGTTSGRTISTTQPYSGNQIDDTERKFYRVDGDLRFAFAGQHHIRFGLDNEDLSESKITALNGVLPLRYTYTNSGVQLLYERLGGNISGQDRAYYIQDSWEPLTGLTINIGGRDDIFKQYNLSGEKYLDFEDNFAGRAGFSYVPNGDSKFRFNGSYGRYFIPPAMNLGFRGRDLYFAEYLNYPGFASAGATTAAGAAAFPTDPTTGLPLANFGTPQSGRSGYSSACPNVLAGAPGNPAAGAANCVVYGAGVQDPAFAKVPDGTKATYEDEFIGGVRFQMTHLLSFGLTGTYRKLSRVSEDTDFAPIIYNQLGCDNATPTGTAAQCTFYGNNSAYYIWNPGKSTLAVKDFTNAATTINLTGLTFPTPRRTYKAVTFDWKRADDGKWSLQGSVTLSSLKGNTEGTVKSDAGNGAQADAGSTQDFDYLGLTDYSYGFLPNNHTWEIKAFGSYHVTKKFLVGADVQIQSPYFTSCEGIHPTDDYAAGYGASSYYCATGPLVTYNQTQYYQTDAPSPRGTGVKTDWLKTVDLSARYVLPGLNDHFLVRIDAFNVFNAQSVSQLYIQHETATITAAGAAATAAGVPAGTKLYQPDPLYLTPTFYQQPRYIRVGFDITF